MAKKVQTLQILGTNIPIESPMILIEGIVPPEEFIRLSLPKMEWKAMFGENGISLEGFFNAFIMLFPYCPYKDKQEIQKLSHKSLSSYWADTIHNFYTLRKIRADYQLIQEIQLLLLEKARIRLQIQQIEDHRIQMGQMSRKSLFDSKKNLYTKLHQRLNTVRPQYEIQLEEYSGLKTALDTVKGQERALSEHIALLKGNQQEFFRQTNIITQEMDTLDSRMQTYADKLEDLDPLEDGEDFRRLSEKVDSVKADIDILKETRKNLMSQSQEVKKGLSNAQNSLKAIRKAVGANKVTFGDFDRSFNQIREEYTSLTAQIQALETELRGNLVNSPESSPIEGSNGPESSPVALSFGSLQQLEDELHRNQAALAQVQQKLVNLIPTNAKTDQAIEAFLNQISINTQKSQKAIDHAIQDDPLLANGDSFFAAFFRFLTSFQSNLNHALAPFEITVDYFFGLDRNHLDQLHQSFVLSRKNRPLNLDQDLKRIEKSYFYVAAITSIYLALQIPIIPLEISSLPDSVITKQTFQKSMEMFLEQFNTPLTAAATHILVFCDTHTYDLSPKFQLPE